MFNFFKKKVKNIQEWEYALLNNIVKRLPIKYSFLLDQVQKDFILDSVPNDFLKGGWKRIILDQNLFDSHKVKDINYQLLGIRVYDLKDSQYKEVALDLYEGVLIGYKIPAGQFDVDNVDLSDVREAQVFSARDEDLKYKVFLTEKKSKQLDLENGFEIDLSDRSYFVIKDLGDGNYLAIDDAGKVYGLFHDPFLVEVIDEDVGEFIKRVNAGTFSIEEYYRSKVD